MSSPDHSTSNNEDAFSSNIPDYVSTILDYSPSSSGKTYFKASIGKIPSEFSPFYNMKDIQEISPKDTETSISPSSSVGSSSPIRSTISPLDYPFDESIFAELDNSLWITPRPLGEEPVPEELNEMPPRRMSTSETPAITLATIQRLITDGIAAALETRAMNTNNTNRNLKPKETPIEKRGNYKEFISFQPFYFNGTEGAIGLIRWFKCTESVFSRSKCVEEDRVTFSTSTLTNDALSWWNAYAQPIGIEQANKITWIELKRLLTNKYCPQTEIKKMEDEFYDPTVKGNDLKTYIRRFQELALLCPNMVPNFEKIIEVFIKGLPRSIEGNVTALKPQTLEEVITITQWLMEQNKRQEAIRAYAINPTKAVGLQKAWGTRLKFSTAFHPQTDGETERTIQKLEDMLRSCALEWTGNWDDYICLVEFAYNNSWHASIKCAPFEMLYGRKCRAPICWDQEKLKEARTRQKSYADKHRRRFSIKGKLSPRFIGPFEILDRVGEISYRLALPPQLSHVHNVFHISLLRGYKYHPLHVISYPLDQIRADLSYVEEPEAILDR
nr:reverse transcriptase domain-containing protein [Tanacetum cinerariifolium]